jgi:hypothetical protein
LKQELAILQAQRVGLQPAPLLHPNLAEIYRQRIERLHAALRDGGTRGEAFELIRSLIDEIRLVPEDGKLRVELRGELAGVLVLAADTKSPATKTPPGLQSKSRWLRGPTTTDNSRSASRCRFRSETHNHLYRTEIYLPFHKRR